MCMHMGLIWSLSSYSGGGSSLLRLSNLDLCLEVQLPKTTIRLHFYLLSIACWEWDFSMWKCGQIHPHHSGIQMFFWYGNKALNTLKTELFIEHWSQIMTTVTVKFDQLKVSTWLSSLNQASYLWGIDQWQLAGWLRTQRLAPMWSFLASVSL